MLIIKNADGSPWAGKALKKNGMRGVLRSKDPLGKGKTRLASKESSAKNAKKKLTHRRERRPIPKAGRFPRKRGEDEKKD